MQVARSARGEVWAVWQLAQTAWEPTAWSRGSPAGAWQLTQAGGEATPLGPCGRWQLAQPFARRPWGVVALAAWQVAQVALEPGAGIGGDGECEAVATPGVTFARLPECASWQLVHAVWPFVADLASAPWHALQPGFATGACAVPWQEAHAA